MVTAENFYIKCKIQCIHVLFRKQSTLYLLSLIVTIFRTASFILCKMCVLAYLALAEQTSSFERVRKHIINVIFSVPFCFSLSHRCCMGFNTIERMSCHLCFFFLPLPANLASFPFEIRFLLPSYSILCIINILKR